MVKDSYFWAWRRLKNRADSFDEPAPRIPDAELVEAFIEVIIPRHASKGSGRFNRVSTYITGVCETLDWLKQYWKGSDELLTAFMLGCEVSCQALKKEIRLIDQRPYEWPEEDWRKP